MVGCRRRRAGRHQKSGRRRSAGRCGWPVPRTSTGPQPAARNARRPAPATAPSPETGDLEYLRTFKFEDLTFRGTIEYRSSCCQPLSEALTVAAFHAGLKEKLYELKEIIENDEVIYSHGFNASELQKLLSKQKLPEYIDEKAVERQLIRILDLSSEGLVQRGLGEEKLLAPLYERVRRHTNPARTMVDGIKNGIPIDSYIRQYAAI